MKPLLTNIVIFSKFITLSGLLLAGGMYIFSQNLIRKESLVYQGIQICGQRPGQSLMGKTLGSGTYNQATFFQDTNSCYGEILSQVQTSSQFDYIKMELNSLAKNVAEFQRNLLAANGIQSAVISKFEAIEEQRFQITELIESMMANRRGNTQIYLIAFFLLMLIGLVLKVLDFAKSLNHKREIQNIASWANEIENKYMPSSDVENIWIKTYAHLGIPEVADKLSAYHATVLEGKYKAFVNKTRDEEVSHGGYVNRSRETSLRAPTTSKTLNSKKEDYPTVSFDKVFQVTLKALAGEFKKNAVVLESDFETGLRIQADLESFSTAFYHIAKFAVSNLFDENKLQKIRVHSQALGGTALIDFEVIGKGVNEDLLSTPINIMVKDTKTSADLVIAHELLEKNNSRIEISTLAGKKGARIRLSCKRADRDYQHDRKKSHKRVQVKRGRKRDFMPHPFN